MFLFRKCLHIQVCIVLILLYFLLIIVFYYYISVISIAVYLACKTVLIIIKLLVIAISMWVKKVCLSKRKREEKLSFLKTCLIDGSGNSFNVSLTHTFFKILCQIKASFALSSQGAQRLITEA